MSRTPKTELICLVGRDAASASMRDELRRGLEALLDRQLEAPDEIALTLAPLDPRPAPERPTVTLDQLPRLELDALSDRAIAPLDALGYALLRAHERLEHTWPEDRPDRVVVLAWALGGEDHSQVFDVGLLANLIAASRMFGWSIHVCVPETSSGALARLRERLPRHVLSTRSTPEGIQQTFQALSAALTETRALA